MALHYIKELRTDFPGFGQPLVVKEVLGAPFLAVAVPLPLLVHVQEGKVVGLWNKEAFSRRIAFLLAAFRSMPSKVDTWHEFLTFVKCVSNTKRWEALW